MVGLPSLADIGTTPSSQPVNYAFAAVVGVWVYDFTLTVGEEVEFILHARWHIGKFLYLVCRYLPFVMVSVDLLRIARSSILIKSCAAYFAVDGYVAGIELCFAEALFVLRIWVLSSRKRKTLIVIICNYVLFLAAMITIVKMYDSSSIVVQIPTAITACDIHSNIHIIIFTSVILVIGEIEIFGFMLYRSWKLYRELGNNLPLVQILARHNAFYFACGLFSSTVVIVTKLTFPTPHASFGDVATHLQIMIHGILATRMHRELWNTRDHRRVTSDESIPLVIFPGPPLRDT